MPTYPYFCQTHEVEFEEFHSITIELEECPICKEKNTEQHKPKRLIAGGSGRGIVELSGHELRAQIKEGAAALNKQIHSSEKVYSNVLGETKYENLQRSIDKNKR